MDVGGHSTGTADAPGGFGPPFVADGTQMVWRLDPSDRTAPSNFRQTTLHRPFGVDPVGGQEVFLGSNAHFIPRPWLPHYDNGVIDLASFSQPKTIPGRLISKGRLIGHVYGGIEAREDEGTTPGAAHVWGTTGSFATNRVFKVYAFLD